MLTKRARIFWFTGLSGSGKTTIANRVKGYLEKTNYSVLVLDGDSTRSARRAQLGFSEEDIKLNNRLIADLCQNSLESYDVILVPIISPYAMSRKMARKQLGDSFFEVFFSTDLNTVVKRDVKGLYKKASRGEIKNMIGFSAGAIYEKPDNPDYIVDTCGCPEEVTAKKFFHYIVNQVKNFSEGS